MRYTMCTLIVGLGAAVHCTAISPSPGDGLPVTGLWGGAHAALTLTDSGGTIQYDCAHGGLDVGVQPDGAGNFEVPGVHVPEHGGPIRADEVPDSVPAHYAGHVSGSQMTLRVFAGPDTLGPFELGRDVPPRLFRCL